jgi:hypothetical protein
VIWLIPDRHIYVTHPCSALLFPSLHADRRPAPDAADTPGQCGDRDLRMRTRTRTRSQGRADRINAERRHNRRVHEAAMTPPRAPDEPPPF